MATILPYFLKKILRIFKNYLFSTPIAYFGSIIILDETSGPILLPKKVSIKWAKRKKRLIT